MIGRTDKNHTNEMLITLQASRSKRTHSKSSSLLPLKAGTRNVTRDPRCWQLQLKGYETRYYLRKIRPRRRTYMTGKKRSGRTWRKRSVSVSGSKKKYNTTHTMTYVTTEYKIRPPMTWNKEKPQESDVRKICKKYDHGSKHDSTFSRHITQALHVSPETTHQLHNAHGGTCDETWFSMLHKFAGRFHFCMWRQPSWTAMTRYSCIADH